MIIFKKRAAQKIKTLSLDFLNVYAKLYPLVLERVPPKYELLCI
jgi:hypothetical protein